MNANFELDNEELKTLRGIPDFKALQELQLEILRLEKSIILLIMDEDPGRADQIISEVQDLNIRINNITIFSNLTLKLNSYYTKIGFIRNEIEFKEMVESVGVKYWVIRNITDALEMIGK